MKTSDYTGLSKASYLDLEMKISVAIKSMVSRTCILGDLDLTMKQYNTLRRMAIKDKLLTEEDVYKYGHSRTNSSRVYIPKLDDDSVHNLAYDVFNNKMSRSEICKKYDICKCTFSNALKRAVNLEYITKKDYADYIKTTPFRARAAAEKKYTPEKLLELYAKGGTNTAKSLGHELLCRNAANGGKATALKNKGLVNKNLENRIPYGDSEYYYNDIKFDSKGELATALLLIEYGLIDGIYPGVNFQRQFEHAEADFFVNENLIVEYHPLPKQDVLKIHSTIERYYEDRKRRLACEFGGKIVVISPKGSFAGVYFYKKMPEMGIKDTWKRFIDKNSKIKKIIKEKASKTPKESYLKALNDSYIDAGYEIFGVHSSDNPVELPF